MFDLFPTVLMTAGGQVILELPESESEFLAVKERAVVPRGKLDECRFITRPIMIQTSKALGKTVFIWSICQNLNAEFSVKEPTPRNYKLCGKSGLSSET